MTTAVIYMTYSINSVINSELVRGGEKKRKERKALDIGIAQL